MSLENENSEKPENLFIESSLNKEDKKEPKNETYGQQTQTSLLVFQ